MHVQTEEMWKFLVLWIFVSEISLAAKPTTPAPPVDCPQQFIRFADSCYYFALDVWLRQSNADNTCKAFESQLAGIETQSEFYFLTREIERIIEEKPRNPFISSPTWRKQFWTSGHREEMGWTWNKGKGTNQKLTKYHSMVFKDWYDKEPSALYEQGVTAMYKNGQWGWNNFVILDYLSFICEKEKIGDTDCPSNFRAYNGSCYLFVGDNDMNQIRATLYCNSLAAHLVAIETQEEWNFIKRTVEEYVEANGESLDYEQWWTSGKQTLDPPGDNWKDGFQWDVTIPQVLSGEWVQYHPLPKPVDLYMCLYFLDNKWYWFDEPRDSSLSYICEYTRQTTAGCKRSWLQRGKSCYLISRYSPKDRNSAEVACMKLGGRLVSIESRDELEFVISRLSAMSAVSNEMKWWTGGMPVKDSWVWAENYAKFTDGSEVVPWSPGEPNNWDNKEDRVTLSLRDGVWGLNDVPIDNNVVLPFICETKLDNGEEEPCTRIVGRKQITRLPRTGGTWANLILNATFTCPGRVTQWRYYRSNTEFSVFAGVWRPDGRNRYKLVGQVEFPAAPNGETEITAPPVTVLPKDVLGIHYPRTAEAGVIAHAIDEDRAVDQSELSTILVLELHQEDLSIGQSVDAGLHTISGTEQCLSIQAKVQLT